jgi:nitrogen fixation NifU-like protein
MKTDNSLYRAEILEHFEHPRHFGKPSKYTHYFQESNRHCGDEISVYLTVEGKTVKRLHFEATGCAISVYSASLLSDKLIGKSVQEILDLSTEKVLNLLRLELTPTRLRCALLPIEAIKRALLIR